MPDYVFHVAVSRMAVGEQPLPFSLHPLFLLFPAIIHKTFPGLLASNFLRHSMFVTLRPPRKLRFFKIMGSMASCARWKESVSPDIIRVVHLNGEVDAFPVPVSAKQMLQNHPRHFICISRDLYGAICPLLQPEEELRLGELYFLLPLSALEPAENLLTLAARLYAAARKEASGAAQRRRRADSTSILCPARG